MECGDKEGERSSMVEGNQPHRGDKIDGTHEGKIPGRLLLGECPVLLRGMYLIVAHLHPRFILQYFTCIQTNDS